jgi:hypothetical protein
LVLDAVNNRIVVVDSGLRAVLTVDLANGNSTVISDIATGIGQTFVVPESIDLDSANNRALVTDQLGGLIAVDLTSGDRTVINAPTADYGANGSRLAAVALDQANNLAYISDSSVDAIFAVDLASGNRTIVSDNATGTASEFAILFGIQGIGLDKVGNRILVTDSYKKVMWQIDLATAYRSPVSSDAVGTGSSFDFPGKFDVDADNGLAYYVEQNAGTLMVVDMATGNRSIVTGGGVGTGTEIVFIADVAVDVAGNRALVSGFSDDGGALFEVDLATGNRTLISDDFTGAGPLLTAPASVAVDSSNNRALVMDWDRDILVAIDLGSGDRSVISDNVGTGIGMNFSVPFDMDLDIDGNRAIVVDYGTDMLMAVDLTSGNRTNLAPFGDVQQLNILTPYYVVLDVANDRAFVYDILLTGITVVNLSTGERAVTAK